MKRIFKIIGKILLFCLGIGITVSKIENRRGKNGWTNGHMPYGFYEKNLKRALDFGLTLFALLFLWPVMLVTALLVKISLGSPVLFTQQRPGLGGKLFTIRKFRTMHKGDGSDSERLTEFGRKLRATSLDELPELFNILSGDMSIIGPRPLLVQYLPLYSKSQIHRHDVRPGLTSLSASKERNLASWENRFSDDIDYVNRITFWRDVTILLNTVKIVFKREGIHSDTSDTMEYFQGNV